MARTPGPGGGSMAERASATRQAQAKAKKAVAKPKAAPKKAAPKAAAKPAPKRTRKPAAPKAPEPQPFDLNDLAGRLHALKLELEGIDHQNDVADGRISPWLSAIEKDIRSFEHMRMYPMAGDHFGEEGM